jgi:hypothetical protein
MCAPICLHIFLKYVLGDFQYLMFVYQVYYCRYEPTVTKFAAVITRE